MDCGLPCFLLQNRSFPLHTVLGPLSPLGPCGISVSFRHNYFSVFFPVLSIQNNARVVLQLTRMVVSWSVAGIMHCMLSGLIPGWVRLLEGAETSVILEDCTEQREPCLGIVLRRINRIHPNQSPAASEQLSRLDMTINIWSCFFAFIPLTE